ncbi:MAG TPA: glycosyltransferase family 39 protein [Pyrinomonadaceae bacterium]|nr:glycosyltransferase family 39 protein [Pyrinomonadaceae bacterium]
MSEISKTEDPRSKTFSQYIWVLLFALVVFTYFFGLSIPLVGPDEPRYAQVAREMFLRHDWITPTLGGFDWFEKPALLYWLQIIAYKTFGLSEFSARVGSALFGLGTIASLWLLGGYAAPGTDPKTQDQKPKTDFANWLALIAATSIGIIVFSRGASFDIILTFPMTAALVGFFIFDSSASGLGPDSVNAVSENPQSAIRNPQYNGSVSPRLRVFASLFAFYFFTGVALIAKGLVGIIFPFAIVAFYYVLSLRFPPKRFLLSLVWGIPLLALVAATWYWPMYERNGYKFINEFIIQHHFQRFTSNKYQHPQPFFFYFWVLPLMTIPWLPFFFISIWKFVKDAFRRVSASPHPAFSLSPLLRFAFAWLLVPLVFFSFSGSKLPGYILPAVPAAIIFAADHIYKFIGRDLTRRRWMLGLAAATLLVIIVLLQFFVMRFADTDSVRSLVAAADARGYSSERVLGLHTVSHNAEFYAAGRLVRNEDGTQKRFSSTAEIQQDILRSNGEPVLVLVPLERVNELTLDGSLDTEFIAGNTELAIVQVSAR